MSKKFQLLMVVVLVTGLLGGLLTGSTVSADPSDGAVIEIPRIDIGTAFATGADWDTKIQVQNVGGFAGGAIVFFWEEYSEECPSNDPGPSDHACMQLPDNGVWTLHNQIPDGAKSAIIYSVSAEDFQAACADASGATGSTEDWKGWVADYGWTGPPLAVTVDRWGTDPFGEFEISSSYTGVSDPDMAGPEVFAPYVMHGYNDLDTVFTIQNSGEWCTSIWIYYKEEGNCEFMKAQHIELLAPGESITVGPEGFADVAFPSPEIDAPWLGSAYISANEPLAVVVDQLSLTGANRGTLLSMRGMPWEETLWEQTWYADLLYREISGYSSSIQVQNLTMDSQPTFVTVDFFDQSGDEILFVGDWVCRNGATTFYLPAIIDLGVNFPFGYVGAAEIQSHGQIDYPGGWHDGEPIFAVVDIKKTKVYDESIPGWRHTVAGETQGGAYNAHPEHQKVDAWGWAMPYIAKEQQGVTSRIVIRNNSNCNKISGVIHIKDETGRIVAYIPVPWLHPKHMKVFDLAYFGQIARGFVGAAEFLVEGVEQLCDTNWDGETDILPVMPSVVVVNYGYEKELPIGGGAGPQTEEGDLTRVYEAIPFDYGSSPCVVEFSGTVIDELTLDPIDEVDVYTAVVDEGPFNISGIAYVDEDCGDTGPVRLSGANVFLQGWFFDEWIEVESEPTDPEGRFDFYNSLELGVLYQVKIQVALDPWGGDPPIPPDYVSYLSEPFVATGDVEIDFTIDTDEGELDLGTGEWCEPFITTDVEYTWQAETDSTGYYSFDYNKTADAEDITLVAAKSGYYDQWEFADGVVCDDQVVNFEMYPECETVGVFGWVEDKETGLPIEGADVEAWNVEGFDSATTDADGYYFLEIAFSAEFTTWVTVSADGYNGAADSVFIPNCDTALISFQLHQTPKSRILLYYGNGGDDEGYSDAEALFQSLGYIVDYTDVWPNDPDLEEYKVIFLLGPGNDVAQEDATHDFTPGQVAQLDLFLRNGGRLVIMSDAGESAFVENNLITALNDFDVQFVDASTVNGALADDLNTPDQLLGGAAQDVHTLDFNTAMSITVQTDADPGYIARVDTPHPQDGATIVAADTMPGITRLSGPAFAGDVVLIGDLDWMDDASFMGFIQPDPLYVWPDWPADNENLLLNLVGF